MHGVTNNFTEYPVNFTSFPMQLLAGYETAYVGKWHMGEDNDEPRPGFDWFLTTKGKASILTRDSRSMDLTKRFGRYDNRCYRHGGKLDQGHRSEKPWRSMGWLARQVPDSPSQVRACV